MGAIATWADYVGYPGGAALRAAGFTGVVRYVGIGGSAKRLTAAEYTDLTVHGLQVLGVVESTTTEADNGYAAGVADAQAAIRDITAITGGPGLDFVFATNDKSTFVQADVDYVAGFASVFGTVGTGAYGFGDFLRAVANAGHASAFWQAGHPPNLTGTQDIVHLWQRQGTAGNGTDGPATPTTAVVGGVTVDINNQLKELPNMTTLDDTFQSEYVGADGKRSTVTLTYAQALQNLDANVYWLGQFLAGEQRQQMPDGQKRNLTDFMSYATSQFQSVASALTADQAALLAAIRAVSQPSVSDTQLAALESQLAAALPQYTVSIAPKTS